MFWERFFYLCESINKKPTPVGKEIGVSSGIISTWKKEGYCPSGECLSKSPIILIVLLIIWSVDLT